MLQKAPPQEVAEPIAVPTRARLVLWGLVLGNVMVVAWMLSAGEWLDRNRPVVTLGGTTSW